MDGRELAGSGDRGVVAEHGRGRDLADLPTRDNLRGGNLSARGDVRNPDVSASHLSASYDLCGCYLPASDMLSTTVCG